MNITEFSIRHQVAVIVLCVFIVGFGIYSYRAMPRESFPDVEFPFVIVNTVLDGGNPEDVEKSVTIPLETELDSIRGLKEMRSVSADSISMISLEFFPDVENEAALNRARDAVDKAKADLSPDAEEPVIKEFSTSSIPVLIYHLVGSGDVSLAELGDLADDLEDAITAVPGVLDVDIFGDREKQILIEVDPERLHFYKLTLGQVEQVLRGTNRNVSAGTMNTETNRIVMRVPGEFDNPAEIFDLVIGFSEKGVPLYLKNIATVNYSFKDEESRARFYDFTRTGEAQDRSFVKPEKCVSLQIKKRAGANILSICENIDTLLEERSLPAEVQVVKGLDQSKQVREMVADLENGIGTAMILVLFVIFLGLGVRNAVLVATSIPFSMMLSIMLLQLMDQTLNMMVLFSLLLALGMLVDNAIVIVENIYRHYSMGATRFQSAWKGTQEVAWPVITSTCTTVGAFFPLLFWPGIMGEFMSYLPMTVIVVLLSSLFVALVINPTLASLFMKRKKGGAVRFDPETQRPHYFLVRQYRRMLEFMLDRPGWVLCTAFTSLLFVFAMYGLWGVGVEFFPPVDPDKVMFSIKPPEGVSIESSERLGRLMEDRIFGAPGSGYTEPVENLKYASVVVELEKGMGGGFAQENVGPINAQVEFVDRDFRTERTNKTLQTMRNRIAGLDENGGRVTWPLFGADFSVVKPQEGPPTGQPVSVDILGEDLSVMAEVIRDMKHLMRTIPGTVEPTDDAFTAQPTMEWDVDWGRSGMFGLEQATVANILKIAVGGLIVGTSGHGDDEKDIVLRLPEAYRLDTNRLNNITIPTPSGGSVPLVSVCSAKLVPGPLTIKHLDKQRILNAGAEVQPGIRNDADIREMFRKRAARYTYPPEVDHRFGGAAEEQEKAEAFLSKAFVIALFIIIVVLVLQFNSMPVSGIVMASVLLSLQGVFLGLLMLQLPFGIIMCGIGVISLAGVVVNNAIVLLATIRRFEETAVSLKEAVVTACMIRFRPVLLTAVTTILGLFPMALKLSWNFSSFEFQYNTTSSQWWQSMAIAVIFGLFFATILTLGVVPALYVVYKRALQFSLRFFNWKTEEQT